MTPPPLPLRFGYGTNGFTNHRLGDVLAVLADLGYDGVALTLDHGHLDPYADDLPRRVDAVARDLARHGLAVTVETGAPYLLDPWGKHRPTLMADGAERRIDLLRRAVRIAADLGSPTVHLCSGPAPDDGLPERDAWKRLAASVETVLDTAGEYGVSLAFEPEPYMFVDTVERCLELAEMVGGHELFGITLDVGHAHCVEDRTVLECVRLAGPRLLNVQIEDMRRGVHQHLELGAGEIDFPPVLAALQDLDHRGLVSVEIQGGSLDAPEVARRSLDFLRAATA
ncbi:sugar phosphate isomerase/epimerase family protein [Streptomyces europaeiscabiei]|uniref:Sugar phosphate isomerase/epimerase n=1 Tax=Streptomyces europaeiscabiei TaxID=146819 RepID=A0ABU4N7Z2_9ACTN|nr:sugar phosphate isomerase/epimerase family protein [Streptomyces europaeiscabiei]MDX2526911.1 sugar phosphate isomerase/epimerase [Streptomyces europaeiscabiei]MDX2761701.1 sugar phosphate isomerase/epimerase [Streptomyces europaeiscabiei]MDX2767322.1 sugar phosphate isomerase/epimerase [Streptomyces europaeiscabiei]MDX3541978.1 sugar phosphate isomerase/epimerase [Streptomyces europaeiscabiei]MDX3551026.1 sugar phosphate isomerase/epimerase [Streptomyces europaeiscabiei]